MKLGKKVHKKYLIRLTRDVGILIIIAVLIRTFGFGLYQVPTGSMETTMLVGERFFADKLTPFFFAIQREDIITFNDPLYNYSSNATINFFQRYVWGPSNWTKRVIGIPGDRVRGAIENGKTVVYVNGQKIDQPFVNKYPLVPVEDEKNSHIWKSHDVSAAFDKQPFYNLNPDAIKKAQLFFVQRNMRSILYPGNPLPKDWGNDIFDVYLKDNQYWVMGDNRLGSSDSRNWGVLDGNLIHGKIIACLFSVDSDGSWWFADLLFHPINFWRKIRWNRCLRWVY